NLRHTPLHIISGEENSSLAFQRGARSFLLKPINDEALFRLLTDITEYNNKPVKDLLIVEDNELDSTQMLNALKGLNINIKSVGSGAEALSELNSSSVSYDCIVVDYVMPDMEGKDLVRKINKLK